MDRRVRETERAARVGGAEAHGRWLQQRLRTGALHPSRLRLAAYAGDVAAQAITGFTPPPERGVLAWALGLGRWEAPVWRRALVAALRAGLDSLSDWPSRDVFREVLEEVATGASADRLSSLVGPEHDHPVRDLRWWTDALRIFAQRRGEEGWRPGWWPVVRGVSRERAEEVAQALELAGAIVRRVEGAYWGVYLGSVGLRRVAVIKEIRHATQLGLQPSVRVCEEVGDPASTLRYLTKGLAAPRLKQAITEDLIAWALGEEGVLGEEDGLEAGSPPERVVLRRLRLPWAGGQAKAASEFGNALRGQGIDPGPACRAFNVATAREIGERRVAEVDVIVSAEHLPEVPRVADFALRVRELRAVEAVGLEEVTAWWREEVAWIDGHAVWPRRHATLWETVRSAPLEPQRVEVEGRTFWSLVVVGEHRVVVDGDRCFSVAPPGGGLYGLLGDLTFVLDAWPA